MKRFGYSISLLLILLVSQVQGADSVTLHGSIVGSDGQNPSVWIGVFELPIRPKAQATRWTHVTTTEFTLPVPGVNELQIVALQKNFVPVALRINPRSENARIDLKFQKGHTVEGVVLSTDDIPVASASLTVVQEDLLDVQIPDHLKLVWSSDDHGQFKIGGLVGNYVYKIDVEAQFLEVETFAVQMPKNGDHRHDLRLSDAFFVRGRVVDRDGARVQDATVKFDHNIGRTSPLTSTSTSSTTTNTTGEFRAGPYPRSNEFWLSAKHGERGTSERLLVTSGERDQVLTLRGMVQVVGTVIDASTGKPIDDFNLVAIQANESRDYSHSGSNGEISCLVDSMTIRLVIDAGDHIPHFSADVNLKNIERFDMGMITLNRARRLKGQVYDAASGEPIARARVSHFDSQLTKNVDTAWLSIVNYYSNEFLRTSTDAKGQYTLSRLPNESTHLKVSAKEYHEQEIQVDPAITKFDIPLTRKVPSRTRIQGKVETTAGNPISGRVLFLNEMELVGRVEVQSDGLFDYATKPGFYVVYAATGNGMSETAKIVLTEDEIRVINLVVPSNGRLSGLIGGLGDGEIVSLYVYANDISVETLWGVENGDFEISGLGTGSFTLSAATTRNRSQWKSFEIDAATREAVIELDFSGNSRLYGTVKSPDGSVPQGRVSAIAKQEGQVSGYVSIKPDGTFEIESLDNGEYTVQIHQVKALTLERPEGTATLSSPFLIHKENVAVNGETALHLELEIPSDSE